MNTLILLGFLAGADPDADAAAAIAIARAARERQPVVQAEPVRTGYPVHAGVRWTGPDGRFGSATAGHLSGHPNHANKFPADWLKTLSHAEIQSLHDDDHDGKVKWEYVPGHAPAPAKPAPVVVPPKAPYTLGVDPNCPTGH